MIVVEFFVLAVVVAAIVATVTAISSSRAQKRELAAGPTMQLGMATRELAMAVRLLDRVMAADEVLPSLPTEISGDIKAFLAQYYSQR